VILARKEVGYIYEGSIVEQSKMTLSESELEGTIKQYISNF
jgi:hypothetical protein